MTAVVTISQATAYLLGSSHFITDFQKLKPALLLLGVSWGKRMKGQGQLSGDVMFSFRSE